MEKVRCKQRCGFEDEFEPDELGINYYQAMGECPNCGADTVYDVDGSDTKVVVTFKLNKNVGRVWMDGYWYDYEHRLAKDREDICLATKDPEQYCNGTFLYSTKDPGDGKEFVVTDTNEPVLKAQLLIKEPMN